MNSSWNRWISRLIKPKTRSVTKRTPGRLRLEALEERLSPATNIWTGGVNTFWDNPGNWSLGRAPINNDDLEFGSVAPLGSRTSINNLPNSQPQVTVRSITISAPGYTLAKTSTGKTIGLSGSLIVGANLNSVVNGNFVPITMSMPLDLNPSLASPNQTFTVGLGTDFVVTGDLAGKSANPALQTLTKAGSGVMVLDGNNVGFTGNITLANSGGIVRVLDQQALGGGNGFTTVNTNSTLQIGAIIAIDEDVILNGSGVSGTGALFNLAGNNQWIGQITLDSNAAIGAAAGTVLTMDGLITDTGAGHDLTKEGAGEIIFAREGGNTYRGQTVINNGTLTIRDPRSLGAEELSTPQAQTVVNYNSTTGEGGTLQVEYLVIPSTDPNALFVDPSKPFNDLTNPVVGFQVFNERLILVGPGFNNQGALRNKSGDNGWNGPITLRSPTNDQTTVNIAVADGTDLRIDGVIDAEPLTADPEGTSLGIPGDASFETPLNKIATGRLIFTNRNTYYGVTTVVAGVLNVRDSFALPDNSYVSFNVRQAGAIVTNGATLELEVDSGFDGTLVRTHGRDLGDDSVNNKGFDSRTIAGPDHWIHGQEIAVPGTSGTFRVFFNTQSTANLAFDIPASGAGSLESALNALSGVAALGGVTVHRSGRFYRVVWNNHTQAFDPGRFTVTQAGGSNASIGPMYGLTLTCQLDISGAGLAGTGVIRSISGMNVYDTEIDLGSGATLGVETDPRVGHPSPDDTYFVYDASLTVPALISGFGNLTKAGTGHLILPDANRYEGDTLIQAGWVTVRDALALGDADTLQTNTLRNRVIVSAGASLHLKPQLGQTFDMNKNMVLSGVGFDHPFSRIDTVGALENLDGVNTVSGLVQLDSVAGIGVEQVDHRGPSGQIDYEDPMLFPVNSQLTMTGQISDFGTTNGGITKLGSRRLIIQTPATYTGPVDVATGVLLVQYDTALGVGNNTTTTVRDGAALELGNTVTTQAGGIMRGLGIWGEHLILNGAGNPAFNDSAITVKSNNGLASAPVNDPLIAGEHLWQGPVTFGDDTTVTIDAGVDGERTLFVAGSVTSFTLQFYGLPATAAIPYTGDPVVDAAAIQAALNALPQINGGMAVTSTILGTFKINFGPALHRFTRLQMTGTVTGGTGSVKSEVIGSRLLLVGNIDDTTNTSASGSSLIVKGGGELYVSGTSSFRGSTVVTEGILTVGSGQALGTSGVAERQTLTIPGTVTQFQLTFNGTATTGNIPYTGVAATDALSIQNALNGLVAIASGVTVTPLATPGTFEVRFGGNLSGFDQLDLTGAVTGGTGTISAVETVAGAGGTVIADGASLYLDGSFTVASEPLRINGVGGGAPPTLPLQWFQQGPAPAANGQTVGNQNVAGRVTGSVADPQDPNVIYIATAGGGAWKTIDGGRSWRPMFDAVPEIQTLTIGRGLIHEYTLDGTFADTLGGPDLVPSGGAFNAANTAYDFGDNEGVSLSNALADPATYSIEVRFNIQSTTSWVSLIEFKNRQADEGLYCFNGFLQFYNPLGVIQGPLVSIFPDTDHTLLWTRNGFTKECVGYIDGVEQIRFFDNADHAVFDGPNNIMNFFIDDLIVPNETSPGSLDRIRIYNAPFTPTSLPGASAATNFTLTFDAVTTPTLNSASPTLAADIQAALNALPTIGGVGGQVTVTQDGTRYSITFGGTLAGANVSQIIPSTGVSIATDEDGLAPQFAMYIGAIAMDPNNNNIIYLGTGETNNTTDSFYGTGVYRSDDAGVSWHLFRGNMVQSVTINNTGGTFTLSFTGPDATGTVVTTTTGPIAGNAPTATVQSALNQLANIGGVGGTVTVTATGQTYFVEFGGLLGRRDVPTLSAGGTAVGVNPVAISVFSNPFDGKGISKLVIDPTSSSNNPRFFMAVGEGGDGRNATQRLSVRGLNTDDTFIIFFTAPDSTGALVTIATAPIVYDNTGGPGNPGLVNTAANIEAALQALPNLGGVGGIVTVTPVFGGGGPGGGFGQDRFDVTFSGALSQTSIALMATNLPLPGPGVPPPTIGVNTTVPGGPVKVRNGTGGGAGVWRYQNGSYFLMTNVVSANRATLVGQTNPPFIPGTPGPDDDFRMSFPQGNGVTWSDVNITFADVRVNGAGGFIDGAGNVVPPPPYQPTLVVYAALGSSQGGAANALYRCENPTTNAPVWYIGDHGIPRNQVETITINNGQGALFNLQLYGRTTPAITVDHTANQSGIISSFLNGTITAPGGFVTVAQTGQNVNQSVYTVTWGGTLGFSPQPLITRILQNGVPGFSINIVITTPGGGADTRSGNPFPTGANTGPPFLSNGNIKFTVVAPPVNTPALNFVTIYAAVSFPNGTMRGVFRSGDGGKTWANVSPPANFMANSGNYATAIYAPNATTAYIGGTSLTPATQATQVFVTTTSGAGWADISSANSVGPHVSQHSIVPDSQGNLLFGNDGGIFRLNRITNTWENLNGNLAISQVNGVASDPTSTLSAFAALQSNGIAEFNNSQTWTIRDKNFGGQMGGDQVYIDPTDSNILYAVEKQLGATAVLRRSTDGGLNWTTIRQSPQITAATVPLVLDRINTSRVLYGGDTGGNLFESMDRGNTWIGLNPPIDVTAFGIASYQGAYQADPNYLQIPDKGINTYDPDTIYVTDGTDIFLTKDHAQTWVDRTGPIGAGIIDIEVDPRNRDHVYVVRNVRGLDQVWFSSNAGVDWEEIGTLNGLTTTPAWKIVLDPRNSNLYLGTDLGVYQLKGGPANWSTSGGTENWHLFGTGLPFVQVKDLELNQTTNTLLAGTYGRSVYTLFLDSANTTPLGTTVTGAMVAIAGRTVWAGPIITVGDPTTGEVWVGSDGTQNLPNGLSAAQIEISGPISDLDPSAPARLVKVGPGDVILSGSNDYRGVTEVREGVIVVDNINALGDPGANTLVRSGAALELLDNLNDEPITLQGDGYSFDGHHTGSLRNVAGDNTYTGPLTLDGNFSTTTIAADSGSSLTLTGEIAGGAATGYTLVKEQTGRVIFAGPNTYAGTTQINQGAIQARHSDAVNDTVIVLDGTAMEIANDAAGNPITVDAPLVLSGTGIFDSGALHNVLGDNTWAGPITLTTNAGFAPLTLPTGQVAIGSDGDFALTITGAIGQATLPMTPAGPALNRSGLLKVGSGEVILSSANTYTGSTDVVTGVLTVRDNDALGARPDLAAVHQVVTYSPERTGSFTISFNGAVVATANFGASGLAIQNAINGNLPAGQSVTVRRFVVPTYDLDGQVGGPPTGFLYEITFAGTIAQANIQVTAVGLNGTIASGTLVAAGGTDVRVFGGAQLQLDGANAPLGSLDVTQSVELYGDGPNGLGTLHNLTGDNLLSGIVRMAANSSVSVAGGTQLTLGGGSTGLDLQKLGTGAVVFDAGPNYDHTLTVLTEGDAVVLGTIGDVLLDGGILSGEGTVGFITSNSPASGLGGTINPGDNRGGEAIGTLTSSGGVLNDTDLMFVSLGTPGNSDVLLLSGGDLDLAGAQLSGMIDPSIVPGDSYTIIQGVGAGDEIFGQFAGPATPPVAGGLSANVVYIGGKRFVADYFTDHVVLTRQLVPVTGVLTATIAAPVYGQVELFVFTLTPEFPGTDAVPSGTVVFTITAPGGVPTNYNVPIVPGPGGTGVATWDPVVHTGSPLQLGTYTYSASYNGVATDGEPTFNGPATDGPKTITVNPAESRTVVTPSLNPSVYGVDVTFTATVTSQVTTQAGNTLPPRGTVTFFDGSSVIAANVPLNASGVAVFTTNALTAGGHSIRALYNSDGTPDNYNPSTSVAFIQTVNKAVTTTAVVTNVSPARFGQQVTFTATITPSTVGPLDPTGTVTFRLGALTLGTGTITTVGGVHTATYTTSATQLPVGTNQTITATYAGNTNYASSSGTVSQSVIATDTVTTVSSSDPTSDYGQQVTFTATITSVAPGTGVPTGTVTFMIGSTVLGSRPVTSIGGVGQATLTTSAFQLNVGANQTVTATYDGSTNYNLSSGTMLQSVDVASTTTTVTTGLSPSTFGQQVTFTARINTVGTPTGTVTFMVGSTVLGTGNVSTTSGIHTATYTTAAYQLQAGANQTITATYNGDQNHASSNGITTQTVNQASSTTDLTSSANPSLYSQSVTFTATVSSPAGGAPTGTVTFVFGAMTLGTVTVSTTGGVTTATYTTTAGQLPIGVNQTVTATYSGDNNYTASGDTLQQTVAASTTVALASNINPSIVGEQVTFTATLTPDIVGPSNPTGTVTFRIGATTLGVVNVSTLAGVTTAVYTTTPTQLTVGTDQTVTATYSGDATYAAGVGTMTQTVNAATTTTLSSSANPSVFGQSVTFTATVASNGGPAPTGTVNFYLGATLLGSGNLSTVGGVTRATYATTNFQLPVGANQTVTAEYVGAGNNLPSDNNSNPLLQTVNPAATTTTLTQSSNPSAFGQPVTFTARVTVNVPGTGAATGLVQFQVGTTVLGTATLSTVTGVTSATFTTDPFDLPVGPNQTITATYLGDGNYATSVRTLLHTVTPAATTTTLTADTPRVVAGRQATLTAQVDSAFGTPAGTVTFVDQTTGRTLGTGLLNASGLVTVNVTMNLPTGNHQIVAQYSTDGMFASSNSSPTPVFVTGTRANTTTVTTSANPAYIGQPITLTAVVIDRGPGTTRFLPTGTVTFFDGTTELGTGTLTRLANGRTRATLTTDALSLGSHQITAQYNGSTRFAITASAPINQNVNPLGTRTSNTTLAVTPGASVAGQLVTLTATVDDTGALPEVGPTGFVRFFDNGTLIGTAQIVRINGVSRATLTTRALLVGTHSLTAVYGGNLVFAMGAPSAEASHIVGQASTSTVLTTSAPRGGVTGQAITFTATVRPVAPGSGTPTGTVTFVDLNTGNTLGVATMSGNQAKLTTTALLPGSYRVAAMYDGDTQYVESTSLPITQVIRRPVTRVTAIYSTLVPATPIFVTGKVNVVAPGSGTPTGTVGVFVDGVLRANATVDANGNFLFDLLNGLTAGKHRFTYSYSGDSNFAASTTTQVVLISNGRQT